MKRYKQLLAAVLALVTVFSLSACGGSKSNEPTPSGDDSQEDLQTITFVLDWTPNTNHRPLRRHGQRLFCRCRSECGSGPAA